jgi:DnaJ-class molecular chaperone
MKMVTSTTKPGNKSLVEDDRWKRKGGGHKVRRRIPQVCATCNGAGHFIDINGEDMECPICCGLGEVDE